MAVDEVLLEAAIEQSAAALRVYQWCEPTVSLGCFQPADDPELQGRLRPLPKVRRLSGGGALLHDQEVTYSIALPAQHPLADAPTELYVLVHSRLCELLTGWGVPAHLRGVAEKDDTAFLCFSRGDPRDIVLGAHKLVGSAQRRRCGAVLQHGALVLRRSPVLPEFPGLFDLAPTAVRIVSEVVQSLAVCLGAALGPAQPGTLSTAEQQQAAALQGSHYATLERRSMAGRIRGA